MDTSLKKTNVRGSWSHKDARGGAIGGRHSSDAFFRRLERRASVLTSASFADMFALSAAANARARRARQGYVRRCSSPERAPPPRISRERRANAAPVWIK